MKYIMGPFTIYQYNRNAIVLSFKDDYNNNTYFTTVYPQ